MCNSYCVACSFMMVLCSLILLLHVRACHDQFTLMASFVNLIAFMESSDSRLCSLVSTLLVSDRLLSTSGLSWVRQSKLSQALVGHNSVVRLLSFASRKLFTSSGELFSKC